MKPVKNILDRFWSKVQITETCWNWTGGMANGYGYIGTRGDKDISAHRFSWELHHAKESPVKSSRMHIDHLCRNRRCVNPKHLELVTERENILRGVSACAKNAKKLFCAKGHPYTKENTWKTKKNERKCRTCGIRWNNLRADRYAASGLNRAGKPLSDGTKPLGRPRKCQS